MVAIDILKFGTSSPADTTPIQKLIKAGYEVQDIIAVIGKTEGNGCVNDFSRTLAQTVWGPLIPEDAITIFSGGTEGVLSPHVSFVVRSRHDKPTGLVASVGHTRDIDPWELGTATHAKTVAETLSSMIGDLNIQPSDVQLVLVKCPLLTSSKIESSKAAGKQALTSDTYKSMALSRYASALGIASALGELAEKEIESSLQSGDAWSARASCSSGAELEDNHIFILASDLDANSGRLRAISKPMADAIDAAVVLDLLSRVRQERGEVVQIFAKAEADPRGLIRGTRHTMNTDSDIQSTRHARAAVGGLLAGLTGDTQIYVSGGAEGQGAPGGGSLCVVYRCSEQA
ncbi:hypothetical protein LTR56_012710 [Elasticomyces elasticus]|nr:hypothetical protein LTR22_022657 [Elasticomyces elasticus]KAK3638987.1 hypothetical protein LTR56_012710 [Elasticomyces elasticus]KAK4918759.1 hypothetical protein LTR49_013546 [Elasticomyces elasticus]KAK5754412.1 hypothetical protein LTS12_015481 [Elasticomyces elasticus]